MLRTCFVLRENVRNWSKSFTSNVYSNRLTSYLFYQVIILLVWVPTFTCACGSAAITGIWPFIVGFSVGVFSSLRRPARTAESGFFFFSLARMDDSRSGKGGISSSTVAWKQQRETTFNETTIRNWNQLLTIYKISPSVKSLKKSLYQTILNQQRTNLNFEWSI